VSFYELRDLQRIAGQTLRSSRIRYALASGLGPCAAGQREARSKIAAQRLIRGW
jgi:hypothetical protein